MRPRPSALGLAAAALAGAALWGAVGSLACAGPHAERAEGANGAHPEVDVDLEGCAHCHAEATPAVVDQWKQGRHGLALVKCVVCHGSTGADFKARPGVGTCRGCHPREVASVAGVPAGGCFSCHPPHALRPQGKASPHGPLKGQP